MLRHDNLLLTLLEGHMVGRNHKGKKKLLTLDDLMGGGTYDEIKRVAQNRLR